MSFEEFIRYVEERYKNKLDELIKEKTRLSNEYEALALNKRNLKPPLFTKKHPFLYAVSGFGIGLFILGLTVIFTEVFPLIPNGMFVIPSSIIASFSVYAGISIYEKNKEEAGQVSDRYLDYQEETVQLNEKMNELLQQRQNCNWHIEDAKKTLIPLDNIRLARECYNYLIHSDLKNKPINIDPQTLDELLKDTPLAVIIYKYYHNELDEFRKLTRYDRVKSISDLNLETKIEKVKVKVEEEIRKQKEAREKEKSMVLKNQVEVRDTPYQRKRRVERNKDNYKETPLVDGKEIGHHR